MLRASKCNYGASAKGCLRRCCCAVDDESDKKEANSNFLTSHSNSRKVPIKTFVVVASLSLSPSVICGRDEKRTKKAILEQILDIPCRSILIRSSKNIAPWLICSMFRCCSYCYVHLFTHDDYPDVRIKARERQTGDDDEGTNAKLSCC